LKTTWWVYSNASLIVLICPAIHEILANEAFIVTDDLISWLFVVAFVSRTKEVDLNFSYFLFSFLFLFWFIFLYFIFRTRVRVRVTRSCCHTAGHIRWHGHKSWDTWKKIEDSGRMMSYNIYNTCWPYGLYMVV